MTTYWVHAQVYKEIKDDGHPIIVISGGDIIRILKEKGISSRESLNAWLGTIEDRTA